MHTSNQTRLSKRNASTAFDNVQAERDSDFEDGRHLKKRQHINLDNVERYSRQVSRSKHIGKVSNIQGLPTPETTPTKPVKTRDCLSLQISPTPHTYSTPVKDNRHVSEDEVSQLESLPLPNEVLSLVHLHIAFLKALSLQFVHSGPNTPIDIEQLIPTVSRLWRLRKVTILDIRRIIGISQSKDSISTQDGDSPLSPHPRFALYDYGGGKICVERPDEASRRSSLMQHLDEDVLNDAFEDELECRWRQWTARNHNVDQTAQPSASIPDFLFQLPLADIPLHTSVRNATLSNLEGERRLTAIKSTAASSAKSSSLQRNKAMKSAPKLKSCPALRVRKGDLLQRIKEKEATQATDSSRTITKEMLARKAALHRLPDIIAILSLLFAGTTGGNSARQTFSLQGLTQRIQDSSKTVLSEAEIRDCITLLADECAEAWISLVRLGPTVTGVVLKAQGKPAATELETWRRDAIAKC